MTTVHYWLLSGRIREAARTSERGRWRVPRHEVIRLAAEEEIEIAGLWTRPKKVLVIDDNAAIREGIRKELEERKVSLELALAATLPEGMRLAKRLKPDVIVVDDFLPAGKEHKSGPTIAFIRAATGKLKIKVIGISGWEHAESPMRAAGAVAFFRKPVKLEEVKNEIFRRATSDRRRDEEKRRPLKMVIRDTAASYR